MKHEITKGSEKDFEGAPEWATLRTFTGGCYFFAEYHGDGARVLDIAQNCEFVVFCDSFDPTDITIIAERRPITESVVNQHLTTEWDGQGIPPVGVEVNFWVDEESKYRKGTVVYSSDKGATVDIGYLASSGEHGDFALITAEDRAREVVIAELYKIGTITMDDAGEIYLAIAADKIPGVKLE